MSSLLPTDVNNYIKADARITSLAGGVINIMPFNMKEPCDANGSPLGVCFIRYFWIPGVTSDVMYFLRRDRIRFYVTDRDYARLMNVTDRLIYMFERNGNYHIPCTGGFLRIAHSSIVSGHAALGHSISPNERDGLAQQMIEVEFRYVPTEGNLNY